MKADRGPLSNLVRREFPSWPPHPAARRNSWGDAGWIFPTPAELKDKFVAQVAPETVAPWIDTIAMLFSDPEAYAKASGRAKERWDALSKINAIEELEATLEDLIERVRG